MIVAGGVFISIEGVDGAGKSTQVRRLADELTRQGHDVVCTHEPGATPLGSHLRDLLLHADAPVDPRAEALLYAADRAQHVAEVIRPALERGSVVITDRYLDSSIAYQGAGRTLSAATIRDLSLWATDGLLPDATLLLDLPVAQALVRRNGTGEAPDRLEREQIDFHQRVRDGFLRLAQQDPERITVIDADQDGDVIAANVLRAVSELFVSA